MKIPRVTLPAAALLALLSPALSSSLHAQSAEDRAALVRNGDMEAGRSTPNFWRIWHKTEGGFSPLFTRDQSQRFAGAHSLRVEHPVQGYSSVQSDLARTAPRIKARAAVRIAASEIEALDLGIQCFDENRRQIRWLSLAGINEVESPWRVFEEEFQLPPGTVTWQFVMGFRGRGIVWLDEVSITALD